MMPKRQIVDLITLQIIRKSGTCLIFSAEEGYLEQSIA